MWSLQSSTSSSYPLLWLYEWIDQWKIVNIIFNERRKIHIDLFHSISFRFDFFVLTISYWNQLIEQKQYECNFIHCQQIHCLAIAFHFGNSVHNEVRQKKKLWEIIASTEVCIKWCGLAIWYFFPWCNMKKKLVNRHTRSNENEWQDMCACVYASVYWVRETLIDSYLILDDNFSKSSISIEI